MPVLRAFVFCFVAMSLSIPMKAADIWRSDKTASCRFEIPDDWQSYTVQWIGTCVEGKADGFGVLKGFEKGTLRELFYGQFKRGILTIGVIELNGGYIAGSFSKGKAVISEDRNVTIEAFRKASAAARWASDFYRNKENDASARYYENKSKRLADQMD
jgi:hypothetical protein